MCKNIIECAVKVFWRFAQNCTYLLVGIDKDKIGRLLTLVEEWPMMSVLFVQRAKMQCGLCSAILQ